MNDNKLKLNLNLDSKFARKLLATLERAFGGAFRPLLLRWEQEQKARGRRFVSLTSAQTARDVDDVRAGRAEFNDGVLVRKSESDKRAILSGPIVEPAVEIGSHVAAERGDNLARIGVRAILVGPKGPDDSVSNQDVDEDWLNRWRAYAQEFSSDDAQQLWARVLANEVENPGAFSLHALHILSLMTGKQAQIVESVAPFLIASKLFEEKFWISLHDRDSESDKPLQYPVPLTSDLIALQTLGILEGVGGLFSQSFASAIKDRYVLGFYCPPYGIICEHSDPNKTLTIPGASLTSAGREIVPLADVEPNLEYLKGFCRFYSRRGFTVQFGHAESVEGGRFRIVTPINYSSLPTEQEGS